MLVSSQVRSPSQPSWGPSPFGFANGRGVSLALTCDALGWRVLSFLNVSGKQPLSHFEIGLSYLWNVGVLSTLNKLSRLNEISTPYLLALPSYMTRYRRIHVF